MTVEGTSDRPADTSSPTTPGKPTDGSMKDTVESILVAFIFAFIFRAFVVEAFVIPTGSMAPTLLGAHYKFTCADCGYAYTVNHSSSPSGSGEINIPSSEPAVRGNIVCPNCGYEVPSDASTRNLPGEATRTNVPVHYGDRILVLKYRYLISDPQRWDVVVFKTPDLMRSQSGRNSPPPPQPYTTNYIKRLVGLPNETIMLLDGDIYVSTAGKPDPAVLLGIEALAKRFGDQTPEVQAARKYLSTFRIQQKPGYAQEAVWRVVHDNDYLPHLPESARTNNPWYQPWVAQVDGTGWDLGQKLPKGDAGRTRVFRFDNPSGAATAIFDHNLNAQTHALTDFLAYDQSPNGMPEPRSVVRDLRLGLLYKRDAGDGPFEMSLTKRDDRFSLEVTRGKARLIWKRAVDGIGESFASWQTHKTYEADVPALADGKAVQLQLANVDYRVSVKVDGKEVLTTGEDYLPSLAKLERLLEDDKSRTAQVHPRRGAGGGPGKAAQPAVSISASSQKCELTHIKVERDLFYINSWNDNEVTSTKKGTPDNLITLGADEFFTLGDNSPISGDARGWTDPIHLPGQDLYVEAGRVPRRFMLGKAFFVYWPAGHRPGSDTMWGIIPNFGEMRFIQ